MNSRKISKAPPPISPLSGRGSFSPRRPVATRPKWNEWSALGHVEAWEAAALSINLDPRSINQWKRDTFPSDELFSEFEMRKRTISSNGAQVGGKQVNLILFAARAAGMGMDIPAELAALAHSAEALKVDERELIVSLEGKNEALAARMNMVESAEKRKRSALIDETKCIWPSVSRDLQDASRNGLSKAAKHQENTFWKLRESLAWAIERGKITKERASAFVARSPENNLSPMLRHLLKLD